MASIRIESRAELLYLLSEAAELEHLLACSYLFGAYSLKTGSDEGLSQLELDAVRSWKQSIIAVAVEEMLHICLVSNLLTSIGGAPNLHRPNLPQMARYYPTDIQLDLAPFNEETIRHFAFLERPEDSYEEDAPRYREAAERAAGIRTTARQESVFDELGIVGRPQGYKTVGELYRGIEYGFRELAASLGEEALFIGPKHAQATQEQVHFAGLEPVTDLPSALGAIQTIVEQGEGLRAEREGTHYWRFIEIEKQYSQLRNARPGFAPARPVLSNPYSRLPTDSPAVNLLDDPRSIAVCDLFNGIYEVMVQLLMRFFARGGESDAESGSLIDAAVSLMWGGLAPVADQLTRLPAGSLHPGMNAGPSFQFFRSTQLLPHKSAAWAVTRERLLALAAYAERLSGELQSSALTETAGVLRQAGAKLGNG